MGCVGFYWAFGRMRWPRSTHMPPWALADTLPPKEDSWLVHGNRGDRLTSEHMPVETGARGEDR